MIVVIGGGFAGLSAALALAPLPVLLITKAPLGTETASGWAQGGIAAAVGADDTPACHAADTAAAGDGLCDPDAVARFTAAGPALIADLAAHGLCFDRTAEGTLALGLEAAHSRRRIVHAGDSTGAALMRALIARLADTKSITVLHAQVQRLMLREGAVAGVVLEDGTTIATSQVVLATGGIGGLYAHTTNPRGAWGQGLLLAGRAGAVLTDLEFVQFHPTALDAGRDPMPLVSEAVRGEGAILVDAHGTRFMAGQGAAELAPRDVVSRAVSAQLAAGNRVFLDASAAIGADFGRRFPAVTALCLAAGIDPARSRIPVRPAAHYHMGGIETDAAGRSSVPGLYAIGECAGTGLHGANRLASNSLLEAGVGGAMVAAAIKSRPVPPSAAITNTSRPSATADPRAVRSIMSANLGVLRHRDGMVRAIGALLKLVEAHGRAADPASVALAIAVAALRRSESRGAHARTDFPDPDPVGRRTTLTLDAALADARALACQPA